MTRILESISQATIKGWPIFLFALVIAGIAWLIGYYIRWDHLARRFYIRKVAEANWEKSPNTEKEPA